MGYRRAQPAQDQLEVRHLRRGRRQHAGEVAACRSRRSSPACSRRWSTRTSRRSPRATRRCRRCCCSAAPICSSRACRRPGGITCESSGRSARSTLPDDRSPRRSSWCRTTRSTTRASAASRSAGRSAGRRHLPGTDQLRWWIEEGQHEQKAKEGAQGLVARTEDLKRLPRPATARPTASPLGRRENRQRLAERPPATAAGARRLRLRQHHREGRRALARQRSCSSAAMRCRRAIRSRTPRRSSAQMREAGFRDIGALALTGYGKDLLKDILGADVGDRRDRRARHRRPAFLPRRRRHLRRRRLRREDHDPPAGHGRRTSA